MRTAVVAVAALVLAGTPAGAVTVSFQNNFPVNQFFEFFGEVSGNDLNHDNMLTLNELDAGYVTFGQTLNFDFRFTQVLENFTSFAMSLTGIFGDSPHEFLTTVYDGGIRFGCGGAPFGDTYRDYQAIDYRFGRVNLDWSGYNGRSCVAVGGNNEYDVGPVSVSAVPLPAGALLLLSVLPLPLLLLRRRRAGTS